MKVVRAHVDFCLSTRRSPLAARSRSARCSCCRRAVSFARAAFSTLHSLSLRSKSLHFPLPDSVHRRSTRAMQPLSRLRKCGDMIPSSTKLVLVKALVFPLFDYCCGLLLDRSKELSVKLQRCMNAALRFALGLKRFEHIIPPYSAHDLMKFAERRDFMCVCLLANILANGDPAYLYNKFEFRPSNKMGSRRCSYLDLVIAGTRTDCFRYSFAIDAAHLWNSIAAQIRASFTRPCFKSLLKNHVLRSALGYRSSTTFIYEPSLFLFVIFF